MKGTSQSLIAILVALLVCQPVLSWAGPGARVIPQGKVSVLSDGKEVGQFQSEMPLPEGSMMLCRGSCLVQTQNIQLIAQDLSVFALTEGKAHWDLTVKSGQVDFAMRTGAKPISFHTPYDSVQVGRAIVPASSSAMVRGSIAVSDTQAILAIHEGALEVMDAQGTQLVQPGQSILLAQTQMTTPQQTKEKEDQDKKKAAAATTGGAAAAGASEGGAFGLSNTTLIAIGVGVAAAIAVGVAVGVSGGGGSDSTPAPVSPL
jgi:hypothetical protein